MIKQPKVPKRFTRFTDIGLLIQMRRQSKAAHRSTHDIDILLVRLRCQQIKREIRKEKRQLANIRKNHDHQDYHQRA